LAENLDEGKLNKQGFDYFYGFNKHLPAHHYYPDSIYENNRKIVIDGNNWKKKRSTIFRIFLPVKPRTI
jgi:hypothetical protein